MSKKRVLLFGAMTSVFASGYGVMFTVLDDFRDRYGIPARWLGMIVSIGFLMSFVAQVAIAPFGDRGHARTLAVWGAVFNIVGLVVIAFGTTLAPLLLGRLISGLGTGMALPALRRIVINADPGRIGPNLGTLFAADVAGFAAGPAVSALMVPAWGLASPFLTIAAFTAVIIPAMLNVNATESAASGTVPKRWFAFDLLTDRSVVAALVMGAAVFLMIGTFDALWAIVLDDLNASDFVANIGVTVFAMPLVVFGPLGGRLAQRVGPFTLGPLGILVGAGFMLLYGYAPSGAAMLVIGVSQAVSDGLSIPSAGVGMAMVAPAERQAGAQGLLGAAETATGSATAAVAGWLYDSGGRTLAYTCCSVAMVTLAVAAYFLASPHDRRLRRRRSRPSVS